LYNAVGRGSVTPYMLPVIPGCRGLPVVGSLQI
jgi:hypothetical protein